MSFTIQFQKTSSMNNKIGKNIDDVLTLSGTLKHETSVIDPVIIVELPEPSPIPAQNLVTSVSGGYNGGATITIMLDNEVKITSIGDSPYNLDYTVKSGHFDTNFGRVDVLITPPANSSGKLKIEYSGVVELTLEINHQGANTSYGYDYDNNYTISGDDPEGITEKQFFKCNYCTIDKFNRKYFIRDFRSLRNNLVEVSLHVDVLDTYEDDIKDLNAIIRRQENEWNLYLDDGCLMSYQNPHVILKKFTSGFTNETIILAVAGS